MGMALTSCTVPIRLTHFSFGPKTGVTVTSPTFVPAGYSVVSSHRTDRFSSQALR